MFTIGVSFPSVEQFCQNLLTVQILTDIPYLKLVGSLDYFEQGLDILQARRRDVVKLIWYDLGDLDFLFRDHIFKAGLDFL